MEDVIKFSGSFLYLSNIHKVNSLQRIILVHSYLYYERDSSVISDKKYDAICKQYLRMIKSENIKDTEYGYVFFDFDGSTGFHLWDRLIDYDKEIISNVANYVLKTRRE